MTILVCRYFFGLLIKTNPKRSFITFFGEKLDVSKFIADDTKQTAEGTYYYNIL
jgi:hypothetical protein